MVPVLQAAAQQGGIVSMVLPIALIFVIFYVFIIRPQNKKQKETQKMIDALKKGDKVVTIGGIHGVISSVSNGYRKSGRRCENRIYAFGYRIRYR